MFLLSSISLAAISLAKLKCLLLLTSPMAFGKFAIRKTATPITATTSSNSINVTPRLELIFIDFSQGKDTIIKIRRNYFVQFKNTDLSLCISGSPCGFYYHCLWRQGTADRSYCYRLTGGIIQQSCSKQH